jgi:hypothetical protein
MSSLSSRIAEAVKDAKDRGITVKHISEACEVSVQSVYQWQKAGERKEIEGTKLVELAAVTGFEALWLMKGKGPKKRTSSLNPMESHLIEMYRGLPDDYRDFLLSDANKYLEKLTPLPCVASPFNGIAKHVHPEKVKK